MADLLFYRHDGTAAVGHIAGGKLVNTDSINGFTPNWSKIVSTT
jgi:hypothetical protein